MNLELFNTMISFVKDGGPFMFPIIGVFILGAAIFIERSWFLSSCRKKNDKFIKEVEQGDGDINKLVNESKSILAAVWQPVFKTEVTQTDSDALSRQEALYVRAEHIVNKRGQLIVLLANVATLLGLLGTIVGLISSFSSVANVSAAEKAEVLSSSISIAMNTTACGLIVAIPLLFCHYNIQEKINLIDSQCTSFNKFISGKIRGAGIAK